MIKRIVATVVACSMLGTPALANISFLQGARFHIPPETVAFSDSVLDNVITGVSSVSGTELVFTGDETLISPLAGTARVRPKVGSMHFLALSLADLNLGLKELRFNINARHTGNVNFTALDQFGTSFTQSFNVTQIGSNWISLLATDDQFIKTVQFASDVDLFDVRQVRIGGVGRFAAIPEPMTWAFMLLGFFGMGAAFRTQRSRLVQAGAR